MKRVLVLVFATLALGVSAGASARVDVIFTVQLPPVVYPPVVYPPQPPVVVYPPQQQCNWVYPSNGMPPYPICSTLPPVVYPPVIYQPPVVVYPRPYPHPNGSIIYRDNGSWPHHGGGRNHDRRHHH
jgi:hypothetical protein